MVMTLANGFRTLIPPDDPEAEPQRALQIQMTGVNFSRKVTYLNQPVQRTRTRSLKVETNEAKLSHTQKRVRRYIFSTLLLTYSIV